MTKCECNATVCVWETRGWPLRVYLLLGMVLLCQHVNVLLEISHLHVDIVKKMILV